MKFLVKNNGILAFLILIIGIISYLAYLNIRDHQALKEAFEIEKKSVAKELDHLISDYDKLIKMEVDISKDFHEKKELIYRLKDSLESTTNNDFTTLNSIKQKASKLEEENSFIFLAVEYLNKTNNILLYGHHD